MSENVVTSSSVNGAKDEKNAVKKTATKKTAAPKKTAEVKEKKIEKESTDSVVVVFESGSSYSSGDIRFTRENNIQEVTTEQAEFLLTLDNFRRANQFEIDDFLSSKED